MPMLRLYLAENFYICSTSLRRHSGRPAPISDYPPPTGKAGLIIWAAPLANNMNHLISQCRTNRFRCFVRWPLFLLDLGDSCRNVGLIDIDGTVEDWSDSCQRGDRRYGFGLWKSIFCRRIWFMTPILAANDENFCYIACNFGASRWICRPISEWAMLVGGTK